MPDQPHDDARTLWCVDDGVPEETTRLLRTACEQRGFIYAEVQAHDFDFSAVTPLEPGALLFRPAVSLAAVRVEQALWTPGVATFYREPDGIFRTVAPPTTVYDHAGLPIPRSLWGNTTNRGLLKTYVEALGGLPIVMKFPGNAGGIGVLRIDTLAGLYSTMDHAHASGHHPLLSAYIADATHWRCVVVGDRVVGFYRNRLEEDDFRTYASADAADYGTPPAPEILELSVRAAQALELEFGGVDILEHPSGRHYLLETNFPCYFAGAQLVGGHDVTGAMLDHLADKARRLEGASVQAVSTAAACSDPAGRTS